MNQEKVINRWWIVFGAVTIQICLGALYAWSLFNQPLADKFGVAPGDVVLTFTYTLMSVCVAVIVGGKLQDKWGPKWLATAGAILCGLGAILTSKATSLTQVYLFYGLIAGFGLGMVYICPLAACLKWFPDKRGFISGLAVAGMGGGALVWKPVIMSWVANYGVSQAFLYLGIAYIVVLVAGAQLLLTPPPGYVPAGWTPPVAAGGGAAGNNFTSGQMLGTPQFYILWVMYCFGCVAGLMIIGMAANIGVNVVGLDPLKAANAVIAVSIFNAVGRIVWGSISDKLGRMKALFMMYALCAAAMFAMSAITMTYATLLLLVGMVGFCFGGFLSIYPSITADFYGTKNVGANYGLLFLAYGGAALVGPKIAVSMSSLTQAFLVSAVLCCIGAAMTFLVKKAPELKA